MADEHIIAASVTLDASEAGDSVEALKKKLEALRADMGKSLGEVKVGTSQAEANIGELKADIASIAGKDVSVDVEANLSGIDALKNNLAQIEGKDVPVKVDTEDASAKVGELAKSIDDIEGTQVNVTVDTAEATQGIDVLKEDVNAIGGASVDVNVNTDDAKASVDELQQSIGEIKGTEIPVRVDTDLSGIDALKDELTQIEGTDVPVTVDTDGATANVDSLKKDIAGITGTQEQVNVEVNTDAESINKLKDDLAGIEGKSVKVDVEADTQAIGEVKAELDSIPDAEVNVKATADTGEVDKLIDDIASVDDAAITVTADTTQAQDDVAKLTEDISEVPPVQVDTDDAQKNVKDLKEQVVQVKSTIIDSSGKIVLDTDEATGKVSGLKDDLTAISDVKTSITVDTTDAVDSVEEIKEAIEDVPDAQVDTAGATASLKELGQAAQQTKSDVEDAGGEIKVETKQSQQDVKELKKDVEDVKQTVDGASGTIKVNTAAPTVKGLKKDLDDVAGSLKGAGAAAAKAGGDVAGSSGHFANLKGQLGALPGPLGQAAKGVGTVSTAFKALLANPVGLVILAIVGALKLLYEAFTATNDGADKMEQIFTGLKAVGEVVLNTVLKLAGAIGKLFSGDFSGAFDDAKAAVTGFGDAAVKAFTAAADAAKRMQEVEDAMRELGVSRAKLNRDLAQTKEIISDENASLAEKKKAIEIVRQAEGAQTAQELENSRKKLKALQDLHKAGDGDVSDDELQAEADAQAAIFQLEEKSAADIRALNKQERSIEKQEREKAREERQKAAEAQKLERQKLVEYTNKLTQLQQENELLLIKDGYEKELKQLQNKIEAEKRANDLAFKDKKITKEQQAKLDEALDEQLKAQTDVINKKHNEEVAKKEADFQKELASIANHIKLKGIKDSRESEKVQLQIDYEERLQDAMVRYKDDQAKFQEFKQAIDAQLKADQDALDEKNRIEDEKKKLDKELKPDENINQLDIEARKEELDADVVLLQEALDKKIISEQEYTAKSDVLAERRKKIAKDEAEAKIKLSEATSNALSAASDIIGKNTAVGKGLAVAASLINTYSAIAAQLRAFAGIPVPGYAIVQALATAAVGFKAVRDIIKTPVPNSSSGGGSAGASPSAPITAAAAPVAPVQASTDLNPKTVDNLKQQSVRAHVVQEDSQAAADRARRLQSQSVLGGG